MTLINETTTGPERKAALCQLLEKEAQLIASIGRHKIVAGRDIKEKQIRAFLNAVSVHGGTTNTRKSFIIQDVNLACLNVLSSSCFAPRLQLQRSGLRSMVG